MVQSRNRSSSGGHRSPRAATDAVAQVLAGERPYTARSVLASTLLGVEPPELPARLLVRVGELFTISEGAARVALSRMVAAGEMLANNGSYRLSGRLLERQARQTRSRHPLTRPWQGSWRVEVVSADSARTAAARSELRAAMADLRLAELREGVWLRPASLVQDTAPSQAVVRQQCRRLDATPVDDAAQLAAQLWDLEGWAARAEVLRQAIGNLQRPLDDHDVSVLPQGFVVSAAVLRHLLADPLLPPDLLASSWPGDDLRAAYELYDTAFKATWRQAFHELH